VGSADELDTLWRSLKDTAGEMITQEWIEGGDSDVYFCLQYRSRSSPTYSFVGRKICQWPPLVGGTASCVSAPEVYDELVAMTEKFFAQVGFVGIGSMEYKRDSRDGRFYMVEPTVGRTDYQEEVATLNGVNLPFAAYCAEIGRAYSPSSSLSTPRIWRDKPSYLNARATGALDLASEVSPGAKVVDAHFRFDDPMPFVALKMEPIKRRLRRMSGRN
jgi:D-aspartate ligase